MNGSPANALSTVTRFPPRIKKKEMEEEIVSTSNSGATIDGLFTAPERVSSELRSVGWSLYHETSIPSSGWPTNR